jgi:WD40 repeat protein
VLFFAYWTSAKLEIEVLGYINVSKYPTYSVKIKVQKDGVAIAVGKETILVLEDNIASRASGVSQPDSRGYQTLEWNMASVGASRPTIFVTYGNELAVVKAQFSPSITAEEASTSFLKFVDNDRNLIKELKFGNVAVGNYKNNGGNVIASLNRIPNGVGNPIRLDSIRTTSAAFKYLWLGSSLNTSQPPVNIISPFPYSFEILFIPSENRYYREYFTVYYDGGRENHIALVGNPYSMPRRTQLQLLQPNGGEILSPCQKYLIKWEGHKADVPTIIEYSTNRGLEWTKIDAVIANEYLWTVPNLDADNVLVRVYQEYSTPADKALNTNRTSTQKVAFSNNGEKLISASLDGELSEFDLKNLSLIKNIKFTTANYPIEQTAIGGVEYFDNDTKAIVAYRFTDYYSQGGKDSVALLDLTKGEVISKAELHGDSLPIRKIFVDEPRGRFIVLKNFANTIETYSLSNGDFIASVGFDSPVTQIAKSPLGEMIAVASLDKHIKLLRIEDFTELKRIDINYLPYVTNLAISKDERFLSFSTKAPSDNSVYGNFSDIYVAEISSGQIVRSLYDNWSDAIGLEFSPTNNYLVIAFKSNPILVFWDLVNDYRSSSVFGAADSIADFRLSSSSFIIATAEPTRGKVILREFNYPETDVSDAPFSIIKPILNTKEIVLSKQLIYNPREISVTNEFCNVGKSPLIIDWMGFKNGRNFQLSSGRTGDTLFPGECLDFKFVYNPIDTGVVTDSIIVVSCGNYYYLPVRGYGENRHLTLLLNPVDFGQVCVGETKTLTLRVATNSDTIALPIDRISISEAAQANFTVLDGLQNRVVEPQGVVELTVQFKPDRVGLVSGFIVIYYLGQTNYMFRIPIQGIGFGTDLSISQENVRFIPEITTRDIVLKNISETDVTIDSIVFSEPGFFWLSNVVPFSLPANSAKILTINWDGTTMKDVQMQIYATPCAVVKTVLLGPYIGTSSLWIETIEHEPKGIVEIPIFFQNTENSPYNGRRFFEGEIHLNPRMFLPFEVTSSFGNAQLLRNEIVSDRRIVGFRVEGDFPISGIIATLKGNIGLAESDTTSISFVPESKFWGRSVQTTTRDGILKLTGLCGNRRILLNENKITVLSVAPNPASNLLRIDFEVQEPDVISLSIFDNLGNKVFMNTFSNVQMGANTINLDVSSLVNGNYRLVLSYRGSFAVVNFIKFSE